MRRDRVVVALKNLIRVIRLVPHRVHLAEGHMSNYSEKVTKSARIRAQKGRGRRTDPRPLTGLFGQVELFGEPREDTVRIPDRHVRIIQPDCAQTKPRQLRAPARERPIEMANLQFCLYLNEIVRPARSQPGLSRLLSATVEEVPTHQ